MELALALPLVVVLVLGMLQVALIGRDQLAVELAARKAPGPPPCPPTRHRRPEAAERVTVLHPLSVEVEVGAATVTVTVHHESATDIAVIGRLINDVTLAATAAMALEPP